ncbi:hypothetical protein E2C01_070577 [Portunus trituberculatus]|uniref:Uncharacterized protein n=1 Tax=Portunus trituberculatus TaxID=210409 RepID=A0A5B7HT34_PORTR|nr:hypothetical protein [Portunus trituberculatus]
MSVLFHRLCQSELGWGNSSVLEDSLSEPSSTFINLTYSPQAMRWCVSPMVASAGLCLSAESCDSHC